LSARLKRRRKKKNELRIGIRNAEIREGLMQELATILDRNWFKKDEIIYELRKEMILKCENKSRIRL
jgi:hypothetical protein